MFKCSIWRNLGGITYEMLIIHVPCLGILNFIIKHIYLEESMLFPVYLGLVLIGASVLKSFNKNVIKKWLFQEQRKS